ncbi:MAG: DMT family transporter [Desulfatibacillaceae bacterium]
MLSSNAPPGPDAKVHARAFFALNGAVLFWGLSFVATKMALETVPTFTLVFMRFAMAAVIFLGFCLYRGFPRISPRDHAKLFLLALFEPGLYFVFETTGLALTTAPKASLIIATIPLVVMVLAYLFLKERTPRAALFGVFVSVAGIGVLIAGDPRLSLGMEGRLLGDVLIFGAVLSASLYIVAARDVGQRHSAFAITSMQAFYGTLFFFPLFLWELPETSFGQFSTRSLLAVAYLTLFATVFAFLCYNYALTRVTASQASAFVNGIPVVTAVAAWALLGERLTMVQALGGAMVLFGVYLANLAAGKRAGEAMAAS